MDVSSTSSAAPELRAGLGQAMLEMRGGSSCNSAIAGLGSFEGVASTTAARVDVGALADGWVWLSDGEGHCRC